MNISLLIGSLIFLQVTSYQEVENQVGFSFYLVLWMVIAFLKVANFYISVRSLVVFCYYKFSYETLLNFNRITFSFR